MPSGKMPGVGPTRAAMRTIQHVFITTQTNHLIKLIFRLCTVLAPHCPSSPLARVASIVTVCLANDH